LGGGGNEKKKYISKGAKKKKVGKMTKKKRGVEQPQIIRGEGKKPKPTKGGFYSDRGEWTQTPESKSPISEKG